jgi:hypothetical protein
MEAVAEVIPALTDVQLLLYFLTPVAASSSAGAPTSFIYPMASDGMHVYSLEKGTATFGSSCPTIYL